VIAVGLGAREEAGKLVPLDLKVGDRILFGKWSGTENKLDGEELFIVKESDVMGIVEGAAGPARKAAWSTSNSTVTSVSCLRSEKPSLPRK
jgi:chaperonin GroES